ncbi:J domain-containing protein [Calothrix sp. UHCC 0171]|uniref:J domain-containing protein n=1 Tax=Calothrix sp. UHCC 0171 TaxID=3110245 RepID=UPI002B1ECF43|nr:J domain-containing protein [Calothrix sp. UHCC 0171]MEA5571662.1 J domain-containing protein [Calothrix sp. UHCC 0171]
MTDTNHYETLQIHQNASQTEIKQAYRRLVKLFHPDSNREGTNPDKIILINAAYEVLGDEKSRQSYDRRLNRYSQNFANSRQQRTATAQQYQVKRQTGRDIDEQVEEWLNFIYNPVNGLINEIINSLEEQIDDLSADPFDDELLDVFQEYLDTCREKLKQAQISFRSRPNPPSLARTAAHIYYCLDRISDGLDEFKYFPLNYDEGYLHTGQEMFRIAEQLLYEAQDSVEIYK